jgi:hypothetical protein
MIDPGVRTPAVRKEASRILPAICTLRAVMSGGNCCSWSSTSPVLARANTDQQLLQPLE